MPSLIVAAAPAAAFVPLPPFPSHLAPLARPFPPSGYTRVGCIRFQDSTYNSNLSTDVGNYDYGNVPSVQACAAIIRTEMRLDDNNEGVPFGTNLAFGVGAGGCEWAHFSSRTCERGLTLVALCSTAAF